MSRFNAIYTILIIVLAIQNLNAHHISNEATKKAIVIGATSGMGREVAKLLSKEGYIVGLVGRRLPLLESLQKELTGLSYIKQIDVTQSTARDQLRELITTMQGLDLMVISISAYLDNKSVSRESYKNTWAQKERTLMVDAQGFIAMAEVAFDYFTQQHYGHLVGISSISGLRGGGGNPVYAASKACISYYMEGMRNYMQQNNIPIKITNIVPGYVAVEHSPLGQDPAAYWEITTEQAGKCIMDGIKAEKKVVYVPSKVWIIAILLRYLPDWIYNRYLSWI